MSDKELLELLERDALAKLTLAEIINRKYSKPGKPSHYGDTYQNGVRPGAKKLNQFNEVILERMVPAFHKGEGMAYVKLFDPGGWTWFISEHVEGSIYFGLVNAFESECGDFCIEELASAAGVARIGIEIDMHFLPCPLAECRP